MEPNGSEFGSTSWCSLNLKNVRIAYSSDEPVAGKGSSPDVMVGYRFKSVWLSLRDWCIYHCGIIFSPYRRKKVKSIPHYRNTMLGHRNVRFLKRSTTFPLKCIGRICKSAGNLTLLWCSLKNSKEFQKCSNCDRRKNLRLHISTNTQWNILPINIFARQSL